MPTASQTSEVALEVKTGSSDLTAIQPEDITLIDAAMGSGHILVYAFTMFMQIYGQEGYSQRDAAKLIIEKNLWGLDIDTRAFQLTYFALMMKARQFNRRFLKLRICPNVFDIPDSQGLSIDDFQSLIRDEQEKENLAAALGQFKYGNEYGSLIIPDATINWDELQQLASRELAKGQLSLDSALLTEKQARLKDIVTVGQVLSRQYTIGAMNPPYMGSGKMDATLSKYVKKHFPNSKSDLFAVFIERLRALTMQDGYFAMVTQHAWMFLSSFEKLRQTLRQDMLLNMAHLGTRAFEEIGGEVVQSTTFVFKKQQVSNFVGTYERLVSFDSQNKKEQAYLEAVKNMTVPYLYRTNQANFTKIPGMPIAYWASENIRSAFDHPISKKYDVVAGISTGDNGRFLKRWYEVCSGGGSSWKPIAKGGLFRKWYGNYDYVIQYDQYSLSEMKKKNGFRHDGHQYYFQDILSWSKITSSQFSVRIYANAVFDSSAPAVISNDLTLLGFLNSVTAKYILKFINPTINFPPGYISELPLPKQNVQVESLVGQSVRISKIDWDYFENSWNFLKHPLLLHIADEKLAHCRSPIGEQVGL